MTIYSVQYIVNSYLNILLQIVYRYWDIFATFLLKYDHTFNTSLKSDKTIIVNTVSRQFLKKNEIIQQ